MANHLPWLPRPLDCIACTACELVCPTAAIRMVDVAIPREGGT